MFLGKECDLKGGGKHKNTKKRSWREKQEVITLYQPLMLNADVASGLMYGTIAAFNIDLPSETYVITIDKEEIGKGCRMINLLSMSKEAMRGLIPVGFSFKTLSILAVDLTIIMDEMEFSRVSLASFPTKAGSYTTELDFFELESKVVKHQSLNKVRQMMPVTYIHWSKWNKMMVLDINCSPHCRWRVIVKKVVAMRGLGIGPTTFSSITPFFLGCEDLSGLIYPHFDMCTMAMLACVSKSLQANVKNHFQHQARDYVHESDTNFAMLFIEYYRGLVMGLIRCDGIKCSGVVVKCHLCNQQDQSEKIHYVREIMTTLMHLLRVKNMWYIEVDDPPTYREQKRYVRELGVNMGYWDELHFLIQRLKFVVTNGGPDHDYWSKMASVFAWKIRQKYMNFSVRKRNVVLKLDGT